MDWKNAKECGQKEGNGSPKASSENAESCLAESDSVNNLMKETAFAWHGMVALANKMLSGSPFDPQKKQPRQKAAAESALENGNDAVSSMVSLNKGKVSATAANEPAESASNFSAANEGKAAAAMATTLMMVNNDVLILMVNVL